MVANAILTMLGRSNTRLFKLMKESVFKSKSTRNDILKHVKEWEGNRVKTTKIYKTLSSKNQIECNSETSILLQRDKELNQRIKDYAEYNTEFLKAERAHAIKDETRRKELPRKIRIKRGELVEVDLFVKVKKNVFLFTCNYLPRTHSLTPGQNVEIIGRKNHVIDDVVESINTETIGRGIVTFADTIERQIIVDISDITSDIEYNIPDNSKCDIEITSDTTSFDRMEKAIERIQDSSGFGSETYLIDDPKNYPLHLWLVMFMESMYSSKQIIGFNPLSKVFQKASDDIREIISYHEESNHDMDLIESIKDNDIKEENECTVPKNLVKEKIEDLLRKGIIEKLNDSQKESIAESLSTYVSLIQGPPGCGKTHTAACIVKVWLETKRNKKKALVLAQSNKAVDQLCSAMLKLSLNITRIGTQPKLQENVKNVHVEEKMQDLIKSINEATISEARIKRLSEASRCSWHFKGYADTGYSKKELINEIITDTDVVCSTLIGSCHKHLTTSLSTGDIGLVIVDEASQASELECLVPLTSFPDCQIILIGDHKQLPPTILSSKARKGSNEYSLFDRLIKFDCSHNAAEGSKSSGRRSEENSILFGNSMLKVQYRMHPAISAFPNSQFYQNKLTDGITPEDRLLPEPLSLWPVINKKKSCIAFVPIAGKEKVTPGKSFSNQEEVNVVVAILKKLLKGGSAPEDIGIISPYMGQVVALNNALYRAKLPTKMKRKRNSSGKKTVRRFPEVNTVDAFQGSEKEVIIISTVRANKSGLVGFLKDWRRMNVALTRAKRGLVVVGDPTTLKYDQNWSDWLSQYYKKEMRQHNMH